MMSVGLRSVLATHQLLQSLDVVSHGGDALGDRPDALQPQRIDGQAPQGGQNLYIDNFAVTDYVFP
jgi:hypothetical protein